MIPVDAPISSSTAPGRASASPSIGRMPVIVVGADTPVGLSIVSALIEPDREVRAFVTDAEVGVSLKARGVKVALGDVSTVSAISRRGESISRSLRIASFAPPRAASGCFLLVSLNRRRRTSSPASRNRTWTSCRPHRR